MQHEGHVLELHEPDIDIPRGAVHALAYQQSGPVHEGHGHLRTEQATAGLPTQHAYQCAHAIPAAQRVVEVVAQHAPGCREIHRGSPAGGTNDPAPAGLRTTPWVRNCT